MLHCSVARRAADDAEVAAAIASIEHAPGIYFGCDAGIAGLHPLQAVLLSHAALSFQLFCDGLVVVPHDAFGEALLRHPALARFVTSSGRGEGRSPLPALREVRRAGAGVEHVHLVGALGFEAHRLARWGPSQAGVPATSTSLGVLYFAPTLLRRDGAGQWERSALQMADATLASAAAAVASARAAAHEPATHDPDARPAAQRPVDDFPPGAYAAIVERAVQRLAASPLVSLTLSQSFRRDVAGLSVSASFETLRAVTPAPAMFFFDGGAGERVFGASPDLQLRLRGKEIEAFPVCGTVARGHGPVGEADSFRRLIDEDVDAASLAVCSDALRNDLAPLCVPGTLRLRDRRRPMALTTVVHTVDRLGGRLRDDADAWDAIVATAAPVMATGTPRHLALEAIGELEAGPRGWYGGLVVDVAANGDAIVGTILRAAAIRDGIAEVRTGGDLLADSDPAREEQESRVKAVSLWRALGLAVAADLQAGVAGAATSSVRPIAAVSSVVLQDDGDPFGAAVADALRGLGFERDARAATAVRIGLGSNRRSALPGSPGRLVAIGDAATSLLQQDGLALRPIRPAHGRIVRCLPTGAVAWQPERPFFAARYATLELDWNASRDLASRAGWHAWLADELGSPLLLAHEGRALVCLLFRPESLMSDDLAREALREAIFFAARVVRLEAP